MRCKLRGELNPLKGIDDRVGGPGTVEKNMKLLEKMPGYEAEHMHYHAGWFEKALPVTAPKIDRIAIQRVNAARFG